MRPIQAFLEIETGGLIHKFRALHFPRKLECSIMLGRKSLPMRNTLDFEAYSQYLIYIVTYKWVKHARMFNYTGLERLVSYKHSSLSGLFRILKR
jgi:hypothetical protein